MKRVIKSSLDNRYLAVFWYVNGVFLGPDDAVTGDSVSQFGDYLQIDKDHWDEWDKVAALEKIDINKFDYTYYPRGRIFYDARLHKFKVVADEKIINSSQIRQQLIEFYNLPPEQVVIFETDEHYKSEA